MDSIWTKTARLPRFAPLKNDLQTDVLIIGGGIAGLLCAYLLAEAGVDYALVEAKRICSGVTKDTTAKVTSQHGLIYHKLIREFGPQKAALYYRANQEALERYRELCRGIDCGFEEQDAFVYSTRSRGKILRELAALKQLKCPADFQPALPLPFPIAGALVFRRQAQLHPLRFAAAIARGLHIYEETKVQELMPGRATTGGGNITANKIIIATHFPILNKHGGYFLKLYQHRSYVLALKGAPIPGGMIIDEDKKGLSFRSWGEQLLLGGGSHRTGKRGGGWRELEAFARQHYPSAQITARWATQDCMTLDGVPYIGRYARSTPDLYVAAGFNKWGMTSAMAAALALTRMVQGKATPYASLFDPARTMLRPQLLANAAESTAGLLTPTVPRCPHLGCALKYNPAERSWDCPCHGSRFGEDGSLLDNPATDDKGM